MNNRQAAGRPQPRVAVTDLCRIAAKWGKARPPPGSKSQKPSDGDPDLEKLLLVAPRAPGSNGGLATRPVGDGYNALGHELVL